MNRFFSNFWRLSAVGLLVVMPLAVANAAGQALFVYGKAYVVSPDGSKSVLSKGSTVQSGDTIVTSANGRVQMRMDDGGLLALRPQTEFVIEEFNYPASIGGKSANKGEPRSFFALVKGGFRSITGAIGKADKSDYGVRTPVATIGIRGTDYTVFFCQAQCAKGMDQGLYVGVTDGGVTLVNDGGSLDLDRGQFGFVRDAASTPAKSEAAARLLAAEVAPEADESSEEATAAVEVATVSDDGDNLTAGNESSNSGAVAFATGPLGANSAATGVSPQGSAGKLVDNDGNPVAFVTDGVAIDQGSSQAVNVGRDTDRSGATGLHWGRWTTGAVTVTDDSGVASQSLDQSSVHWVSAADGNAPVSLPTEGTADFVLIGNTNPTDNHGNVGTLGSASLSADFTSQTADADVSLSIDATNQVWDASAEDVDINSDATFGGEFDSVTVSDSAGTETGTGDLSGFFSGDSDGNLSGAGMTYTLEEGGDVVSGGAAFQVDDGT